MTLPPFPWQVLQDPTSPRWYLVDANRQAVVDAPFATREVAEMLCTLANAAHADAGGLKVLDFSIGQALMLAMGQWSEAQGIVGTEETVTFPAEAWRDLQARLDVAVRTAVHAWLNDHLGA